MSISTPVSQACAAFKEALNLFVLNESAEPLFKAAAAFYEAAVENLKPEGRSPEERSEAGVIPASTPPASLRSSGLQAPELPGQEEMWSELESINIKSCLLTENQFYFIHELAFQFSLRQEKSYAGDVLELSLAKLKDTPRLTPQQGELRAAAFKLCLSLNGLKAQPKARLDPMIDLICYAIEGYLEKPMRTLSDSQFLQSQIQPILMGLGWAPRPLDKLVQSLETALLNEVDSQIEASDLPLGEKLGYQLLNSISRVELSKASSCLFSRCGFSELKELMRVDDLFASSQNLSQRIAWLTTSSSKLAQDLGVKASKAYPDRELSQLSSSLEQLDAFLASGNSYGRS